MVRDRQQEGLLPVAPGVGIVSATSGAMAIAARVEGQAFLAAREATPKLAAEDGRAADGNIPQGAELVRAHTLTELLPVRRAVAADDVRQFLHLQVRHHPADLLGGGVAGLLGHVGIGRGGGRGSVPQPVLNEAQIDSRLQ